MSTKILIPYYSAYGHIYEMVQSVAEGAKGDRRCRSEDR